MDYLGIIKKAYEITIKHKYLWIFGILAGGIGGFRGLNTSFSNGASYNTNNADISGLINLWTKYDSLIITLTIIFGLIAIIWWIFSIIANAGLLGSVEKIAKNEPNNFKIGVIYGWQRFWKVLGTSLIIILVILFSISVLVLPIILFVMAKFWPLAIVYGIIVFLIDLVLWLYLSLIYPYILRLTVLGGRRVFEAYSLSWSFFGKNWQEIVVMYLLSMAIGIGVGIALIISLLLVGGLLFGIGFAIFLASKIAVIFYGIIAGLLFIVTLLIVGGLINTFNSSVVTLTYMELIKKPS